MAYHVSLIRKGEYGCISKIQEELDELKDATLQKNKIMALIELSDMIGAIEGFLQREYPFISLEDLKKMSDATRSAFMDGTRK